MVFVILCFFVGGGSLRKAPSVEGAVTSASATSRVLRESKQRVIYCLGQSIFITLAFLLTVSPSVTLSRATSLVRWRLPHYMRYGLRFGLNYETGFVCHPEPVEGSHRFICVIGLV